MPIDSVNILIKSELLKIYENPITGIKIKERKKDAKLKEVTLTGLFGKTYVWQFGEKRGFCNCFKNTDPYVHKACDAIVLTEIERKWYILFIEMKSFRKEDYCLQLKNTDLFLDYVFTLLDVYYNKKVKHVMNKIFVMLYLSKGHKPTVHKRPYPCETKMGLRIVKIPNPIHVSIKDLIT